MTAIEMRGEVKIKIFINGTAGDMVPGDVWEVTVTWEGHVTPTETVIRHEAHCRFPSNARNAVKTMNATNTSSSQ